MSTGLYYYKAEKGNFGDDLNAWIWPRLIPEWAPFYRFHGEEFLAENEMADRLLIGIGTLLDDRLPKRPIKLICGTGAGYRTLPVVDSRWHVHWVRGPHTAARLGLAADLAISDCATILARLERPAARPPGHRPAVGFMPHHDGFGEAWRRACHRASLIYVDPTAPVEQTLSVLGGLDWLITEAMHGAIVADALRIPWLAVSSHAKINAFKWQDWCGAFEMAYQPKALPALWSGRGRPLDRIKGKIKEELAALWLSRLARRGQPMLSSDRVLTRVLDRLETALATVRKEIVENY